MKRWRPEGRPENVSSEATKARSRQCRSRLSASRRSAPSICSTSDWLAWSAWIPAPSVPPAPPSSGLGRLAWPCFSCSFGLPPLPGFHWRERRHCSPSRRCAGRSDAHVGRRPASGVRISVQFAIMTCACGRGEVIMKKIIAGTSKRCCCRRGKARATSPERTAIAAERLQQERRGGPQGSRPLSACALEKSLSPATRLRQTAPASTDTWRQPASQGQHRNSSPVLWSTPRICAS
jgi:hypothetical protein